MPHDWNKWIDSSEIPAKKPLVVTFEADEEECDFLRRRLDVLKVHAAGGRLTLKREAAGWIVHVYGRIYADIEQSCVVSLDPVRQQIEEDIEAYFADKDSIASFPVDAVKSRETGGAEGVPIKPEYDDPEPMTRGHIDLADLTAQFIGLGLDPYPHRPDLEDQVVRHEESPGEKVDTHKPFAGLDAMLRHNGDH